MKTITLLLTITTHLFILTSAGLVFAGEDDFDMDEDWNDDDIPPLSEESDCLRMPSPVCLDTGIPALPDEAICTKTSSRMPCMPRHWNTCFA